MFLHNLLIAQENQRGGDVQEEVHDVHASELTDGPTASDCPGSPNQAYSVANVTSRSPVLSVSSLQGAADTTMSKARQLRKSPDSSGTFGRAVMQLNQEAQKEVNRGRKESVPVSPVRKESSPMDFSSLKKDASPPMKESSAGKESSRSSQELSPGMMEFSSSSKKLSPVEESSSSPGREASGLLDGDELSSTVRARPRKIAASNGGNHPNKKHVTEDTC